MKKEVTEKRVKDHVKKIIDIFDKYNDLYTFCPMTFGFGASGHPDRFVLVRGVLIGIEVKKNQANYHFRPNRTPNPSEAAQAYQAKLLRKAHGQWVCICKDNIQDLIDILDKYADEPSSEFANADKVRLDRLKEFK